MFWRSDREAAFPGRSRLEMRCGAQMRCRCDRVGRGRPCVSSPGQFLNDGRDRQVSFVRIPAMRAKRSPKPACLRGALATAIPSPTGCQARRNPRRCRSDLRKPRLSRKRILVFLTTAYSPSSMSSRLRIRSTLTIVERWMRQNGPDCNSRSKAARQHVRVGSNVQTGVIVRGLGPVPISAMLTNTTCTAFLMMRDSAACGRPSR
jgi:hypothetical protein